MKTARIYCRRCSRTQLNPDDERGLLCDECLADPGQCILCGADTEFSSGLCPAHTDDAWGRGR